MENNNKETTNAKTKSGARKYAPYITGAGIVAVLLFLFVASPMLANAGKVGLANSTQHNSFKAR